MDRRLLLLRPVVGAMVITLLVFPTMTTGWAQKAAPYELPKTLYWASGSVGAIMYTISATIADKVGPVLGVKIRMIPGGDAERFKALLTGKAHMGFMASDIYWATMGMSQYCTFDFGPMPIRMVWPGLPLSAGSTGIATVTSGIKTPYDLKGKRMGTDVTQAGIQEGLRALLAFGKLTMDDVKVYEFSGTGAKSKGLGEGKIDFTQGSLESPSIIEAAAGPHGVNPIRYPPEDKEGWARFNKVMPYMFPGYSTRGAGIKPGEKVPTTMYPFPVINCLADLDEAHVYAFCKALHSKLDELIAGYSFLEALRVERGISREATIMAPYHPGAIKFFKEIGVWKEAYETANKKRVEHMDKVKKRWSVFVKDAQERTKTGKKVDLPNEWREIIEKEIGLKP